MGSPQTRIFFELCDFSEFFYVQLFQKMKIGSLMIKQTVLSFSIVENITSYDIFNASVSELTYALRF